MKKLLLIIISISTFLMLPSPQAKAQVFNPLLASMLQDSLTYYVTAIANVKGMSAAVYLPGQGVWQGTAGLSYAGQPITSDMKFGIASNTKLFVSAAVLKLVDNNILSLDDHLSDWLPTYPNINPNITIRQLLNHTSGVQDPLFLAPWMDTIMANPTRVFTPVEVLGWVGAPLFPVGTSWGYSNVNYILAGMVVQSATGKHISEIIRDSILTPLNLNQTFYDVEEPAFGTIAHRWFNGIDYNDTSRVGLNTAGGAAGSIFSTSADMVNWYHAIMTGQVLSPASFIELKTFVNTYGPAYTYGLGLENQNWFGHNTCGHGGSTWGYKSKTIYDPCMDAAVCGLANSHPAGMDGITLILYRVLVNHIPGCPGTITGLQNVLQGQNNVTYTTTPIANASTYIWTLPNGATGISNTNSITVNYGWAADSGFVTVRGNNAYGPGNVASLFVNVIPQFPLPVSLQFFKLENRENTAIELNWATASESACDYFSVERSADGVSFESIGKITGNGTTHESHTYTFTDKQPLCGPSYYRLQQVDFNGSKQYSQVLSTGIICHEIDVYPNPFTSQCTITFFEEQKNTKVILSDLSGKEVRSINFSGKILNFEKGDLSPGTYFIEVIDQRNTEMRKKITIQ